ncbi:MAG: helix-turn-helix domain-containing protein [Acidimicrobiales bacterium]
MPTDFDLALVRRRCTAAEAAALELAEEVKQLAKAVTELVERPAPQPRAVSVEVAARLLGLSRSSLYELLERGALRSVKVGGRRLVPVAAIDDFLSVSSSE